MSAKIARGAPARGKPKGKSIARGGGRKAPPPPMLDALPLEAETIRRVSSWLFLAVLLAVVAALLAAFRIPQLAGIELGEAIGRAGFSVQRWEIKGIDHMSRAYVDEVAENQVGRALPLVDLAATRRQLMQFGWIEEARVSRRYPDTLVVDIIERRPAAIWQHGGKLALIDKGGVVLEAVKVSAMPDLPIVIGPAANLRAGEFEALLASAPALKPMLEGATWVGGRRWDLRFQSGETLALPEGREAAARALADFTRMDKTQPLLGRGLVRFDMRIPGKFVVRVSREPGQSVADLAPPPPQAPPAHAPAAPAGSVDLSKTI